METSALGRKSGVVPGAWTVDVAIAVCRSAAEETLERRWSDESTADGPAELGVLEVSYYCCCFERFESFFRFE